MAKQIKKRTAQRWLNRNKWNIAKFLIGAGAHRGSNFHKQLILCRRSAGDVRFRSFK